MLTVMNRRRWLHARWSAVAMCAGLAIGTFGAGIQAASGQAFRAQSVTRTATLSLPDLTFAGASQHVVGVTGYTLTAPVAPMVFVSLTGGNVVPGSASASGSGSIAATLNSTGSQTVQFTLQGLGAGPGTRTLAWSLTPWDDPASRFRRLERNGRHALLVDMNLSVADFATNAALNVAVRIPGDWTTIGQGTGQVNPVVWPTAVWNFSELLTFDGTFTTIRLNDTFRSQAGSVRYSFELVGAEIPTPGACTLLVTAGGVMWTMRRRRVG